MHRDPLKPWIERADMASPAAPARAADDLASRVRSTDRRRRRLRRTGATVLLLGLAAGVLAGVLWNPPRPRPQPNHAQSIAAGQAELVALREEVALRQARVESLLLARDAELAHASAQRHRIAAAHAVAQPDPADVAAMILVREAERRLDEYGQTDAAIADLRQVVASFPGSIWADEARRRLSTIDPMSNP
jgi:hypothetical protein